MALDLVTRASAWSDSTAVVDGAGAHSYDRLLDVSERLAGVLLNGRSDLAEARVAFMIDPSFDYVVWQWAIWRAGGIAVPLSVTHPAAELAYVLEDSRPEVVVADAEFVPTLAPMAAEQGLRLLPTSLADETPAAVLPDLGPDRRAMMLYTSGTTGRPKGVVTTHGAIHSQITSLVEAWGWRQDDRTLLVLPLHHVHGIVNVVGCALWIGAVCEMLPRFDAAATWDRVASGELSVFMAVPTVYHRLIDAWEAADPIGRESMSRGCESLRLMVSGSAALPVSTLERWKAISGHVLLERYGMTEIGMALSNALEGERFPGHVGRPLPGMEVRLVDEEGRDVADDHPGEIQVRGPNLFLEYWDRPDATTDAFVDGWFKTGDVAVRHDGIYRILGRSSVDILKTGGEKVSALEVEEVLLRHDAIREVAVVGVPDPDWGQRVVAVVVPLDPGPFDAEAVREWCREFLAPYKVPKQIVVQDRLPRNALGKVTKPEIVRAMS